MNRTAIIGSIASMGLLLSVATHKAVAQTTHKTHTEFQRIEQPLWAKAAVTAGGLGLIALELWWFLRSKPN
ncbi:MAG: hypothetical protein KME21_28245 [Desmonostoc vinosum HA7617-LM4]|nr:hypothetical protein [Desmonostoc vinosum HA7617-LM4]